MIQVIAQFHFQPERLDEVQALWTEMVETTRQEEGCLQYDLMQADADPCFYIVLEKWASQTALDAHSASAHFTRIVPKLSGFCSQPPLVSPFVKVL